MLTPIVQLSIPENTPFIKVEKGNWNVGVQRRTWLAYVIRSGSWNDTSWGRMDYEITLPGSITQSEIETLVRRVASAESVEPRYLPSFSVTRSAERMAA